MAPTTTLAPRVTFNQEIYRAQLDMDVDRCSPYQPAGILPGSGQVQPRWISSVFKSAMRYDYNELLHKSLLFVQAQRSGHLSRPSSYEVILLKFLKLKWFRLSRLFLKSIRLNTSSLS